MKNRRNVMKKLKKIFAVIILLNFMINFMANLKVFASNTSSEAQQVQYSKQYLDWLKTFK